MSRRPAPLCQWEDCTRAPVGFRIFWLMGTMFVHWFCRRHQRRWDRGMRGTRHLHAGGGFD